MSTDIFNLFELEFHKFNEQDGHICQYLEMTLNYQDHSFCEEFYQYLITPESVDCEKYPASESYILISYSTDEQ